MEQEVNLFSFAHRSYAKAGLLLLQRTMEEKC